MTKRLLLLLLLLPAFAAIGCATEEPGINPSRDTFYFPTSLALDHARQRLYVTNTNADLQYNGSTLMPLSLGAIPKDLSQLDQAVKSGALKCEAGVLDPTVWECKESQFAQAGATLRMGDFPSSLVLAPDGKRVFVTMRGQNYLLWADVVERAGGKLDLRCNNSNDGGCAQAGGGDCAAWDCDGEHRVTFSEQIQKSLPSNPFGLVYNDLKDVYVDKLGQRRTCIDGVSKVACAMDKSKDRLCKDADDRDCWHPEPGMDHLYAVHLSGGEVSYFTVEPTRIRLRDFRGGFFSASGGVYGGYGLAPTVPGDGASQVFVSSRVDNVVASFVIKDNLRVLTSSRTPAAGISPAADVRGISYDARARRLYLVNREPPALLALDMAPGLDGNPKKSALWAAEVCSEPSLLQLGQDHARPGQPSAGLAYVVCFGSAQIYVVDLRLGKVIDQIPVGKGPHSLVLDDANKRAFIANFIDNSVGVIDLDPSHARFNRMAMRIGTADDLVRE